MNIMQKRVGCELRQFRDRDQLCHNIARLYNLQMYEAVGAENNDFNDVTFSIYNDKSNRLMYIAVIK